MEWMQTILKTKSCHKIANVVSGSACVAGRRLVTCPPFLIQGIMRLSPGLGFEHSLMSAVDLVGKSFRLKTPLLFQWQCGPGKSRSKRLSIYVGLRSTERLGQHSIRIDTMHLIFAWACVHVFAEFDYILPTVGPLFSLFQRGVLTIVAAQDHAQGVGWLSKAIGLSSAGKYNLKEDGSIFRKGQHFNNLAVVRRHFL